MVASLVTDLDGLLGQVCQIAGLLALFVRPPHGCDTRYGQVNPGTSNSQNFLAFD
jgi:hypothetical protein